MRYLAEHASGTRSKTKRWMVRYPRAVPLAIFALITAVTVLSIFSIEQAEDERASASLRSRAVAVASALERRANSSSAYLRAGAALLASLERISSDQFVRFASELRLDSDYRGSEGIGWAPIVPIRRIAAFEKLVSEETGRSFEVWPRPGASRRFVVPVTYLHPDSERNRRALGFDMFTVSRRAEAMLEAERTSLPTATERLVLVQEGNDRAPGFLIYMPVFESSRAGRRLKGYIYSPFRAAEFLDAALQLEDAGDYAVRLYDGDPGNGALLASSGQLTDPAGEAVTQTVSIGNNPWVVEISSADSGGLSGLSMATLIFGLLVASLLMLLVRMLTQQALEDEASLRWFEEQASIRNSLTRELNHRVKNTLANVLSIIALTRRRATGLADFADGLDGRIRALSATHDLLTNSDWGTTPVRAVVEAELFPYAQGTGHVVELEGPAVELAPNDALSLGLAVHELATNAAKYGALSQAGGRVEVRWRLTAPNRVRIEWLERGGPPVAQERGRGFGTDLIERIVAHELESPVELGFEPAGVRCVLTIRVRRPSEFAMRARKAAPPPQPASPTAIAMQRE